MPKPTVGGYNWRRELNKATRLCSNAQKELIEMNRDMDRQRIPSISMLIAEIRLAVIEMASIAEGQCDEGD